MSRQGMSVTVIGCDGRPPGSDATKALAAALAHPKAAILTAPGTAADLARELQAAGKTVYAAELLGTPEERVTEDPAHALADPSVSSPSTRTTRPARRAGWPATRAPRTAGPCPRTRSSTATR